MEREQRRAGSGCEPRNPLFRSTKPRFRKARLMAKRQHGDLLHADAVEQVVARAIQAEPANLGHPRIEDASAGLGMLEDRPNRRFELEFERVRGSRTVLAPSRDCGTDLSLGALCEKNTAFGHLDRSSSLRNANASTVSPRLTSAIASRRNSRSSAVSVTGSSSRMIIFTNRPSSSFSPSISILPPTTRPEATWMCSRITSLYCRHCPRNSSNFGMGCSRHA